jgi:hypothetical protein
VISFEKNIYSRQVYTLMSLLSDVGGAQASIMFIGKILTSFSNERLLYFYLIRHIYQSEDATMKR